MCLGLFHLPRTAIRRRVRWLGLCGAGANLTTRSRRTASPPLNSSVSCQGADMQQVVRIILAATIAVAVTACSHIRYLKEPDGQVAVVDAPGGKKITYTYPLGKARRRSEERRVGKECVSTCKSRGS